MPHLFLQWPRLAIGGGFEIVLAADLVVAAEGARFWLPEARAPAERVVRAAPLSVAAVIEIGVRTGHLPLPEAFGLLRSGELAAYEAMLASEDSEEGPRAFTEGRSPRRQGC